MFPVEGHKARHRERHTDSVAGACRKHSARYYTDLMIEVGMDCLAARCKVEQASGWLVAAAAARQWLARRIAARGQLDRIVVMREIPTLPQFDRAYMAYRN
jgi:hypothetical protein